MTRVGISHPRHIPVQQGRHNIIDKVWCLKLKRRSRLLSPIPTSLFEALVGLDVYVKRGLFLPRVQMFSPYRQDLIRQYTFI